MQREISISGHKWPDFSAAPAPAPASFTGDYDFATCFHPSIFPPEHSPLLDYSNDGSFSSPSMESEDALGSYFPQIQQQQRLHQDLMGRHQKVLFHLSEAAKQAQSLRQENVNLKMANFELKNRLNLFHNGRQFHGVDLGPSFDSVEDGLRKMSMGVEEEGTSENEAVAKSPTSVMDSGLGGQGELERVNLPKSISVRSSGYLKAIRAARKGDDCVKASNQNKTDNETQKVYVKGGKEQPLELEVYNQGMIKTELCNKWQQTGACPYGDNCQFAHGIQELRPVVRHPRYKTEVCRMVLNGVPCPYGHRCHFRHSLTEEEQLTREINSNSLNPMNYR
ncbi:hypothetical protein ABFX02_12G075000 [Erythranthe guttata]